MPQVGPMTMWDELDHAHAAIGGQRRGVAEERSSLLLLLRHASGWPGAWAAAGGMRETLGQAGGRHVSVQALRRAVLRPGSQRAAMSASMSMPVSWPIASSEEREVFGDDVAGRAGRVGASADDRAALESMVVTPTSSAARPHWRDHARACCADARRRPCSPNSALQAAEQALELLGIGVAAGVGQADLVDAARRHRGPHAHPPGRR